MIRKRYLAWLQSHVWGNARSHSKLAAQMHSVPFNDSVPNDYNRSAEGEQLRDEFLSTLRQVEMGDYAYLYGLGKASILEMLVALSRRADFNVELGAEVWAQTFIENLGLGAFDDRHYNEETVAHVLDRFNNREYTRTGAGGIFPLRTSRKDQRRIELWYQMAAYLHEQFQI